MVGMDRRGPPAGGGLDPDGRGILGPGGGVGELPRFPPAWDRGRLPDLRV